MMQFEPVIGLEIHVQLATHSKIFSSSSTAFGATPNTHIDPVCLGLPGALPVLNQKVVKYAVQVGLATHCQIRLDSQFARKHYFYPDLPKGYQISQFDRPICEKGWITIDLPHGRKKINITRIHMEEDAGKLVHSTSEEASFVDLNRAGMPLLEIVSEPEIRSPEEAKAYMEKIHSIVTYLGVSSGDMEKGHLRCDANVSVRPVGQEKFGTRTEIKNVNSFRNVQQAVTYEIERQIEELLDGQSISQETRLWDADRKRTYTMRKKEEAHDYRYFPDPDLPVVQISQEYVDEIANGLPELPEAKCQRFLTDYQLSEYDAGVLVKNPSIAQYYEEVVSHKVDYKLASNWVQGELIRLMNESKKEIHDLGISVTHFVALLQLIEKQVISGKMAKTVFDEVVQSGKSPQQVVEEKGLTQVTDEGAILEIIDTVMAQSSVQVEQYRSGKTKVFGFFVGQVMKATRGKASPEVVNRLLKKTLDSA